MGIIFLAGHHHICTSVLALIPYCRNLNSDKNQQKLYGQGDHDSMAKETILSTRAHSPISQLVHPQSHNPDHGAIGYINTDSYSTLAKPAYYSFPYSSNGLAPQIRHIYFTCTQISFLPTKTYPTTKIWGTQYINNGPSIKYGVQF